MDLRATWQNIETRMPYLRALRPFKTDHLYDLYDDLFNCLGNIRNILELGVYKGGSLVLWREAFGGRVVGIDLSPPAETVSLIEQYVTDTSAQDELVCYWETSQTDSLALSQIVSSHFSAPLDVVIDDASHLYSPTRRAFEILFPLLRPSGLYIIEDWAAWILPAFQVGDGPLDQVLKDIIDWMRDGMLPIESLRVTPGCAVVTKGAAVTRHATVKKDSETSNLATADPVEAARLERGHQPAAAETYGALQHALYERDRTIETLQAQLAAAGSPIQSFRQADTGINRLGRLRPTWLNWKRRQ